MDSDDDCSIYYSACSEYNSESESESESENESDSDSDSDSNSDSDSDHDELKQENIQEVCKYESLDETGLKKLMNEIVERINLYIPISSNLLRILLNHFNWDEDELLRKFYDGDQEKLFRDANISNPFEKDSVARSCDEVECLICVDVFPVSEMHSLGCDHIYCNDCWSRYLENQILDEGMGENITCAAHNCGILMDDETCLKLLNNDRAAEVYQTLIKNGFVAKNPNLIWCSKSDCTYALKYTDHAKEQPIICKCGANICCTCGHNWHIPLQCNIFKKWLKKCQDDSETKNWIAANTKECPKCNFTIEKRGGCNHMTCGNKICRYHFCWICMGDWNAHNDSYNCNRFQEVESKTARNALEHSRFELKRYLFHYNRYMEHKKSLELEEQLRANVYDKMVILKETGIPWMEMQFLTQSVDVLRQCRTTLMYTYAFAYYLQENNQCFIFLDNQADLQKATESLSEYLESNIESDNYSKIKQTLNNLKVYCDSRCKVLESHVLEGYEQNLWKYRDY